VSLNTPSVCISDGTPGASFPNHIGMPIDTTSLMTYNPNPLLTTNDIISFCGGRSSNCAILQRQRTCPAATPPDCVPAN
jgi:hypothetical protein